MKRPGWSLSSAALMGGFVGAVGVGLPVFLGKEALAAGSEWATIYSALITGAFTVIAVWGSIYGVSIQIRHQADAVDTARGRDLKAARATLPLSLVILSERAERCMNICLDPTSDFHDFSTQKDLMSHMEVDTSIIADFREVIRHADETSGEWLSAVLRQHQICRSRTIAKFSKDLSLTENNYIGLGADWLALFRMVEHCLGYARGEATSVPVSLMLDAMILPLSSSFYRDTRGRQLRDYLDRQRTAYPDGKRPRNLVSFW